MRGTLAGNGHHRSPVHVGVRDPGDQIGRAGPQRRQAYTRLAGQAPVYVGHEGGALFVPHGDEPDVAVEQRIHDVQVLFARNAEDVLDPFVLQATHKQFGTAHGVIPISTINHGEGLLDRETSPEGEFIYSSKCVQDQDRERLVQPRPIINNDVPAANGLPWSVHRKGCRVGESILHREVQNLSCGSGTPGVPETTLAAVGNWGSLHLFLSPILARGGRQPAPMSGAARSDTRCRVAGGTVCAVTYIAARPPGSWLFPARASNGCRDQPWRLIEIRSQYSWRCSGMLSGHTPHAPFSG